MDYLVQHFFAGTWDLIWHWGIGVGLLACFILAAIFSPVFKRDFVYCAIVVGVFLLAMYIGTRDEAKRVAGQQTVINDTVNKVVKGTQTPQSRSSTDRWDNPNN